MSLNTDVINMDALIGSPDPKVTDMRRAVLDMIVSGKSTHILIDGNKFRVLPAEGVTLPPGRAHTVYLWIENSGVILATRQTDNPPPVAYGGRSFKTGDWIRYEPKSQKKRPAKGRR